MLARSWPRALAAKFAGEQRPELQDPSPHRFVGEIQSTLSEQIFDVAITEGETNIEPNRVFDDRRGNWWRANEIVMRHLTRRLETRYRCRDKALGRAAPARGGRRAARAGLRAGRRDCLAPRCVDAGSGTESTQSAHARSRSLATAFINHDLSVIRVVCDRVYVMKGGPGGGGEPLRGRLHRAEESLHTAPHRRYPAARD
jgi:hypothetical protein